MSSERSEQCRIPRVCFLLASPPVKASIALMAGLSEPLLQLGVRALCGDRPELACVCSTDEPESLLREAAARDGEGGVVLTEPAVLKPDGVAMLTTLDAAGWRTLLMADAAALDDAAALIRAGASGFVARTATADELVTSIRAAAAGQLVLERATTRRLLHHDAASPAPALSPREREVLMLVARGRSNEQIAAQLYVATTTVKTHLMRLNEKLGTRRRSAAVAEAMRRGLLDDMPA